MDPERFRRQQLAFRNASWPAKTVHKYKKNFFETFLMILQASQDPDSSSLWTKMKWETSKYDANWHFLDLRVAGDLYKSSNFWLFVRRTFVFQAYHHISSQTMERITLKFSGNVPWHT